MTASISSERLVVQIPLLRYGVEAGWTYLKAEDAMLQRRGEEYPILWDVLIGKLQALNPTVVDHLGGEDVAKRIIRILPSIEGNQQAWEFLRGLKTVFHEAEHRERNVRFIDFDNPENNVYHVTDEFKFTNGTYRIRADVVFLINGIPVLVIEAKSATKLDGIPEALEQIRRYHREAPECLALAQLFGITHLISFFYGATWSLSHKNVFNWKDEGAGKDFESLVKYFVQPQRLLRIIRDFILFTRKDDELSKVVLRPHQMRAVERSLTRAADPKKSRGLVWHTQGSGKTFTMITLAKRLIEEPVFANPTVLMLVDRTELEAQLFGNLASLGIESAKVARSKEEVKRLLASDTRGLIVSMIHKFDGIPAHLNDRKNIFVLVDEAHRTTGGDLGNYLMGALPNATYLGFTGTPIDRTAHGKGTFKVFGSDDEKGYLDKYSIAESIDDGTTVPLYYSIAPNELRVDRETLEKEFLNLAEAEGMSDVEDLNRVLEKAVTLRNMLKNRERINRVAAYVAEHYRNNVEPMGYKAFLVGVDREACALYKDALDKLLPPEYSQVVISAGHNDPPELKQHHLSDNDEKRIRKEFVKSEKSPKILVVTEKLLTGFDAPVLYCMYLDKPMRDHVLLQAIARVNRPYEDENSIRKPGGFVVDFVGIFENLENALAFDSKDVQAVVEGLDILQERFVGLMVRGRAEFLPLIQGRSPDKAAESALEHFRDEEVRQAYYQYFRELEDLYEILSPSAFLREYVDDYQRLSDLYALIRAAYEGIQITDRELARKTAKLVQEHTQAGLIKETLNVFEINSKTLDEIASATDSDTVKVFNLIKSISQVVVNEGERAPYLISIGERAERIASEFRERQASTEEALKKLEDLVHEINAARQEQSRRSVSAEAFTVFWLLKQSGVDPTVAEAAASEMMKAFDRAPHWRTSEAQARDVRKALYVTLVKAEVTEISDIAERIMRVVGRETRQ